MGEQKIPTPPAPEGATIEAFCVPKSLEKRTIVLTVNCHKDTPLPARRFAALIQAQVGLLEAIDKEQNGGKRTLEWCVTEAAVIGDRASFSVTGYHRAAFVKSLRKARAEAVVHPGPGPGEQATKETR